MAKSSWRFEDCTTPRSIQKKNQNAWHSCVYFMCTMSFIITPPTVQSTFNSNTTCKTDRPQKRLTQIAQKFSKTAQTRFLFIEGRVPRLPFRLVACLVTRFWQISGVKPDNGWLISLPKLRHKLFWFSKSFIWFLHSQNFHAQKRALRSYQPEQSEWNLEVLRQPRNPRPDHVIRSLKKPNRR